MIDQKRFCGLMSEIVTEVFPEETTAFQIEGQEMVADLYVKGSISTRDPKKAEFGFSLSSSDVIEFVKLLTASFTLMKTASEWLRPKHTNSVPDDLAKRWKTELTKAGLPANKSDEIVRKFATQLSKSIG